MAFYNTTQLVQRVLLRLRQVQGVGTQTYSEPLIIQLLEEVYEECRAARWWDHLMQWSNVQLDGVAGLPVTLITGCRERYRDVKGVFYANNSAPLPFIDSRSNPSRLQGTRPRAVEPLHATHGAAHDRLFRIWPLASVTTVDTPIRVYARQDPAGLFTDVNTTVPFDATALVNGVCLKYTLSDNTNPGGVAEFDRAWNERMRKLMQQHDEQVLPLDGRNQGAVWPTDWFEVHP
jgi:hypothetical protein